MLLKLREKTTGWIAGAIVVILVVPFALVGVGDYFTPQTDAWVARVGEVEIGEDEYRARFEDYRQQVRRQMGDAYDSRQIDQPSVRRRVLDRMVDEELLRQASAELGVVVTGNQLQKQILEISAFQVDGRFDPAQYRFLLSAQNMTPRGFEARLRRDLEANALPQAVMTTGFASPADVDRFLQLRDQRRDIRHLTIEAPSVDDVLAPTEDELVAFHAERADRYMTEEQVEIEYVMIDSASIEVPATADEDTLRRRYDEQRARFMEPEQRLTSHILVSVAPNADADAQRDAQSRAATLAAQARAPGADFAALAGEHSDDPGSRASGGDLGWLETGITDPAFESALFALQAGEVSEPVKSADGWHVILLRDVREGRGREFAEVRAELEQEFLETERERLFNDRAGRMVDAVYRDPTSLQAAADELDLEIRRAGPFGRAGGDSEISSHPSVLQAAFSDEVMVEGNVSDVIDLGDGRMVAIRGYEHLRARPIPLEEIREQVVAELVEERRLQQARDRAVQAVQRLGAGETMEALAEEFGGEVRTDADIGRMAATAAPPIVSEAFRLPHPQGEAVTRGSVDLGNGRHALIELQAVRDGDPAAVAAAERSALREQLGQVMANSEVEGLMQALRQQIPVRIAEQRMQGR
jgi:peptidyl-prolyl cis-trans isomerase D